MKDYSKFKKKKVEKVKIKPKTGSSGNYSVPYEVRKKIKELSLKLPPLPYLINVGGKLSIQQITKAKVTLGSEILKNDPNAKLGNSDQPIYDHKNYISKGKEMRLLNHEVELTSAYRREGNNGIGKYLSYCDELNTSLQKEIASRETKEVIQDAVIVETEKTIVNDNIEPTT